MWSRVSLHRRPPEYRVCAAITRRRFAKLQECQDGMLLRFECISSFSSAFSSGLIGSSVPAPLSLHFDVTASILAFSAGTFAG